MQSFPAILRPTTKAAILHPFTVCRSKVLTHGSLPTVQEEWAADRCVQKSLQASDIRPSAVSTSMRRQKQASTSSLSCLRSYRKRRKGRTITNHAPSSLSCLRFYLKCHKKGKRHTSCPSILNSQFSILNSQFSLQMIRLMLHDLHRPIQLLRQNQARHLMRERHLRQFQTKIRPLSEIVSVSERPAD